MRTRGVVRSTSWIVAILLLSAGVAAAGPVSVDVALDHGIYRADTRQTGYVRVGVTAEETRGDGYRAPLNVAIVIDRSGSMAGEKIEQAKRAALAALDQMRPDDIVSVVAYDTEGHASDPAGA